MAVRAHNPIYSEKKPETAQKPVFEEQVVEQIVEKLPEVDLSDPVEENQESPATAQEVPEQEELSAQEEVLQESPAEETTDEEPEQEDVEKATLESMFDMPDYEDDSEE